VNAAAALAYLNVGLGSPSLPFLNEILTGWSSHIPWESISRIARHQTAGTPKTYACAPDAFFENAIRYGTGGTCFESNFALHALLSALGFESALAFCDMEGETENPHCALTVRVDDTVYLADAGYPVRLALPLDPLEKTQVDTGAYIYYAEPVAPDRWAVTRRSADFLQNNFTLKAEAVDVETFWARLLRDHEPDGCFLDSLIISKTFPSYSLRYSEDRGFVRRSWGAELSIPLLQSEEADLPETLARHFGIDPAIVSTALERAPLA
jgi:arylamine N-acetyltransferase